MYRIILAAMLVPSLARAEAQTPLLPGPGNLRIGVTCVDQLLTHERGLDVRVDGTPVPPARTNRASTTSTDSEGNTVVSTVTTDVGYVVSPGRHHVRVAAPECAPFEVDLDAGPVPHVLAGRLAVSDPSLTSPTAAPDGMTFELGVVRRPIPAAVRTGTTALQSDYTIDSGAVHSFWLGSGVERRRYVFAFDTMFGGGSVTGTTRARPDPPFTMGSGPSAFTATILESSIAVRIGGRFAVGDFTFAAGSGIGGTIWMFASSDVDRGGATTTIGPQAPTGPAVTWFVPVWAAATYKPHCTWGLQALASSDRTPGVSGGTTTLSVGFVFQPTSACSESAGVSVTP